jgi:plastocyanin
MLPALIALGATAAIGLSTLAAPQQQLTVQPVSIVDFDFQPATVTIAVGESVTWTNAGATAHTVTSTTGAWESGTITPTFSFTRTFAQVGSFPYRCEIHHSMQGTIAVVQADPLPSPSDTPTATPTIAVVPNTPTADRRKVYVPNVQGPVSTSTPTEEMFIPE